MYVQAAIKTHLKILNPKPESWRCHEMFLRGDMT